MNVLVSGLVNIETSVKVRSFPIQYYPIDYPFFGISSVVAGVGYNIAKALHTLGDDLSFISYAGNDASSECIMNQLHKDGIPSENIKKDLKETAQSVVLYDETGRRQIYCDLKDIQEREIDCSALHGCISNADIIAACNSNFNRPLLVEAKRLGKTIATDVHVLSNIDDDYNRDFLSSADIVFLSDEQIPCSPEDFIYSLKEKYGMKIIIMGQGKNGAMLYSRAEDRIQHFDAVKPAKILNTVGAGDALFSCFIHFYGKGLSAQESLKRAQLFASIKIGYNGASSGFVNEKDLEKAFEKAY